MNAMFEGYGSTGPAYDEMYDGDAAPAAVRAAAHARSTR